MKTLEAEKGKSLDLKPCKNCIPKVLPRINKKYPREDIFICPCPSHSGEIQRENGKITRFSCENRVMRQAPKIKPKVLKGMPNE